MSEISNVGVYKLHLAENMLMIMFPIAMVSCLAVVATALGTNFPLLLLLLLPFAVLLLGSIMCLTWISAVMRKLDPYGDIHK